MVIKTAWGICWLAPWPNWWTCAAGQDESAVPLWYCLLEQSISSGQESRWAVSAVYHCGHQTGISCSFSSFLFLSPLIAQGTSRSVSVSGKLSFILFSPHLKSCIVSQLGIQTMAVCCSQWPIQIYLAAIVFQKSSCADFCSLLYANSRQEGHCAEKCCMIKNTLLGLFIKRDNEGQWTEVCEIFISHELFSSNMVDLANLV